MVALSDVRFETQLRLPPPAQVAEDIRRDGFAIYKDVVDPALIEEQRVFWLDYFKTKPVDRRFVRGRIFLGERNFNSFSAINEWCMYRQFAFPWNAPEHELTTALHLHLHRHRNLAQGFDEMFGLAYNSRNYGIYISTSYYPPGRGFLKTHRDGHQDTPLLHYMLPLTFKGRDYQGGGLVCEDTRGQTHDVDAAMGPGDIVYFDGRQPHGVETIQSTNTPPIGRLAIFAIPTFFLNDTRLGVAKRSALIQMHEVADRLHVKSLLRGLKR